jgi:hypothetical protein
MLDLLVQLCLRPASSWRRQSYASVVLTTVRNVSPTNLQTDVGLLAEPADMPSALYEGSRHRTEARFTLSKQALGTAEDFTWTGTGTIRWRLSGMRAWRRGCPRHARWSGSRRSCSHGRRRARAGGQRGNKHDGRRPRSGSCSWHGGWSGSRERRMRSRHPAAAGSAMLSDIPAERWTSFQLPVLTRRGGTRANRPG